MADEEASAQPTTAVTDNENQTTTDVPTTVIHPPEFASATESMDDNEDAQTIRSQGSESDAFVADSTPSAPRSSTMPTETRKEDLKSPSPELSEDSGSFDVPRTISLPHQLSTISSRDENISEDSLQTKLPQLTDGYSFTEEDSLNSPMIPIAQLVSLNTSLDTVDDFTESENADDYHNRAQTIAPIATLTSESETKPLVITQPPYREVERYVTFMKKIDEEETSI